MTTEAADRRYKDKGAPGHRMMVEKASATAVTARTVTMASAAQATARRARLPRSGGAMRRSMRRAAALPPAPRAPAGIPAAATARGAARRRVVSCHLDQVRDLLRAGREEPDPGKRALERGGEPEHEMMPPGQV